MDMLLRDYEWFLENYSAIFEKYGDTYVAIKDGNILGNYNSYAECVREISKTEKLGTFIVQHCDGKETGYTSYIASIKTSQNAGVDLNVPARKKTPEEREAIRERIFREREAAFDMLAKL